MRNVVVVVVVALLLLAAPEALACSVCFDPKESRRFAFLVTTLILTATPLSVVFGTIFWLRRAARRREVAPPAE
jgi:hypothetical protein